MFSLNTVRRASASDAVPKYQRVAKGSIVDAFEPQTREPLQKFPDTPATVIGERTGWTRAHSVLKRRVRELRPLHQSPDPVSRTGYEPGELVQCNLWFPPAEVPLRSGQVGSPPVLVMVCGYSRWIMARMLPTRSAADLIGPAPTSPSVWRPRCANAVSPASAPAARPPHHRTHHRHSRTLRFHRRTRRQR